VHVFCVGNSTFIFLRFVVRSKNLMELRSSLPIANLMLVCLFHSVKKSSVFA
jgi:hypothetical protein